MTTGFKKVTADAFDTALRRYHHYDRHELLQSTFYTRDDIAFAMVIRHLQEDGELKPEADLLLRDPLPDS